MAKDPKVTAAAKVRAAEEIIPDLFDVAQSYEDHAAQYNLGIPYENEAYIKGKQHTWTPAPKLPRAPASRPRKSKRRCSETERKAGNQGNETDWGSESDRDGIRNIPSENGSPSSILLPEQCCSSQLVKQESIQDHQSKAPIIPQRATMPGISSVTTAPGLSGEPPVLATQGPLDVSPATFFPPPFTTQWSFDIGNSQAAPIDDPSTWTYRSCHPCSGPRMSFSCTPFSDPSVPKVDYCGSNPLSREQREVDRFTPIPSPHMPYQMPRPPVDNPLAPAGLYSHFGSEVPGVSASASARALGHSQSMPSSGAPDPCHGLPF